jgi:hypothetical protein
MRPEETNSHLARGWRPGALRGALTVALLWLVVACGAGSAAIIKVADYVAGRAVKTERTSGALR